MTRFKRLTPKKRVMNERTTVQLGRGISPLNHSQKLWSEDSVQHNKTWREKTKLPLTETKKNFRNQLKRV